MPMQSEIRREFDNKHGPDRVLIGAWYLYADGAQMEESPYGCTVDPPTDPVRRAALLVRFRRVTMEQAVRRFDRLKEVLSLGPPQAKFVNGVEVNLSDPIKQLTELRDEVLACKRRLDAAEAAYRDLTPEKQREAVSEARRVEKLGEFKQSVGAISI